MLKEMTLEMATKLVEIRQELNRAQEEADQANLRVAELETQERALQAALDMLEGKAPVPVIPPYVPNFAPATPLRPKIAPGSGLAMLNGDAVILEPGMRLGKNSFGEQVIVPIDSVDPPLMAEPSAPMASTNILAPIADGDKFGAPEDLL
jgi:hypothetical protein